MSENEIRKLRNQRRYHRESKLEELDKLLGDAEERNQRVEKQEDRLVKSGVWGVLHGRTATEQILTPWFVLITLLTVLQMLRMNFFIATIKVSLTSPSVHYTVEFSDNFATGAVSSYARVKSFSQPD